MSPRAERRIVLLLASVQFVNILDFMIVMPLGPDFAAELGIPLSHLGIIGGSYTLAAAVSGLLGAFFLDRFDRRPALALALLGLAVGTIGGAFAQGLTSLVLARVIAGLFGGPATSLAMSIVADSIPAERRGRALGTMMIAFSVASIIGVPAALELAHRGSWHTPFIATGALAFAAALAAWWLLPPLREHLERAPEPVFTSFATLLSRPATLLSYALTGTIMTSMFALVPNIAGFVQENLGYPRESLGLLYGAGGLVSFVTLRPIGALVDRFGSFRIGTLSSVGLMIVTWAGFVWADPRLPVVAVFVAFMFFSGARMVAYNTLATKVPAPHERARFMSLQSMVQHLGSAVGAFASSQVLLEGPSGELIHMDLVAWLSIALALLVPPLLAGVEMRVVGPPEAAPEKAPEKASEKAVALQPFE